MKLQSNISWYKAISNVNQIFINLHPSIILSQQFLPRVYNVRAYIGPRESTRTLGNNPAVKYNAHNSRTTENDMTLPEKYQGTKQPQR